MKNQIEISITFLSCINKMNKEASFILKIKIKSYSLKLSYSSKELVIIWKEILISKENINSNAIELVMILFRQNDY